MKCQACDKAATTHITEIVAGQPVEYHVCETHVHDLEGLKPVANPGNLATGPAGLWSDAKICAALQNSDARKQAAAYFLPASCLALLDPMAEVRIIAAFRLMELGPNARSAMGALQDALQDPDERVSKAARIALEYIEADKENPWFF